MDESEIAELRARVAEAERERDDAEARAQSEQVQKSRSSTDTSEEPLEPVGSTETAPPAANDLRARLARTAARKKPGGGPDPT